MAMRDNTSAPEAVGAAPEDDPIAAPAGGPETTVDAFLGGAVLVEQPAAGYRAGLDAVLLAASWSPPAAAKPVQVADVGAGVGTAGLCLATRLPDASVTLIERDPLLARLAAANAGRNRMAHRIRAVTADVLAPANLTQEVLPPGAFDIAISNPPYLEAGQHRPSAERLKAAAHAMPPDGLDRWLRFMTRILRPGGTAVVIHRADRLDAIFKALQGRFGGVTVVPLYARQGTPASRIIVIATKASRAPLSLAPGIVLHGADGAFLPAIKRVLTSPTPLDWAPR